MSLFRKKYEDEFGVIESIPDEMPERVKVQFYDLHNDDREECKNIINDLDHEYVCDPLEHVSNLTEEEWNNCFSMYAQANAYNIYDASSVLHTLVRNFTDLYVKVLAEYLETLKGETNVATK